MEIGAKNQLPEAARVFWGFFSGLIKQTFDVFKFFCLWKIWEPWQIRDILDFAK